MRLFLLLLLLCNTQIAVAQDFDEYCKKSVKGKITKKKKKNICWCVEENMRSQLTAQDREWLLRQGKNKKREIIDRQTATEEPNEMTKKRILGVEFQVFKNCSANYRWKGNSDDLGVPDDITAP